jgi:hypothetical protein
MLKIGDHAQTNAHWNNNHDKIEGVVTAIIPLKGNEPLPLIELNGGESRINEFWLEKMDNEFLEMC